MSGREDIYQRAMDQGNSAAWDQSWTQAAEHFRQAVEEFPERSQALTSLGLALYEMQSYEESLRYYGQAARVSPQDPLPVEKIAQIYERAGNLDRSRGAAMQAAELYLKNRDIGKAIENWRRVLMVQPENMQAHTRLAMVFERLGRKDEAVAEYLAIAALFQRARDGEKAMRAVSQALEILPGKQEAMEALSTLRENKLLPMPLRPRSGTAPIRTAQVRQLEPGGEGETALKMDPISEARQAALTSLAAILFDTVDENSSDSGNRRGIQAIMRGGGILSKSVDRTRIVLHLGQLVDMQSQGDLEQAANELERAIDAGLDHAAAYYDLGYLHFQLGRYEQAMKSLQQAVSHPDYALGARLLLGQAYYKTNELRDASVAYMHALSLADAAMLPKEQSEALRQQYDPLIEAQSHETNPLLQRQVCDNIAGLLQEPKWRENIQKARQQLSAAENGDDEIVPLAEVLTQSRSSQIVESLSKIKQMDQSGFPRSAMEEAFYAIQFAPTYLPLHAHMGELLLKQGQMQEAQQKLLVVAQAYSSRGEARRATQIYKRVIELAPMDLIPRIRLIDQLIASSQTDDALKEYMDFADVYYALADLEKSRRTLADALRVAQQSRVDKAWQVKILHRMADIDLQSLDWRQAVRIFEQIRNLQPDDEKSRASLVDLNSRLGQDDRAQAELDNYLTYMAGKGQRERAIKFLENLVREDPSRTWTRRRLAEFYQALGRNADAISQWDALGDLLVDEGNVPGAIQAIETIMSLRPPNLAEYQRLLVQLRTGVKG